MNKFFQTLNNTYTKVKDVGRKVLDDRKDRLSDPALKAKLEALKIDFQKDLFSAGKNGAKAVYEFTLKAAYNGAKEGLSHVEDARVLNARIELVKRRNKRLGIVEDKKHKGEDYVFALQNGVFIGIIKSWGDGGVSTAKAGLDLIRASGRGTLLASRYIIAR